MPEDYRIELTDRPADADHTIVGFGLRDFNERIAGPTAHRPLCLFLHAPDGATVGGLVGATYYDWFFIELLWVKEELRGQGHGHRLLAQGEDEARHRGAHGAFLDTFSFQAPGFYRECGYQVFGELPDFPHGHSRIYFWKRL